MSMQQQPFLQHERWRQWNFQLHIAACVCIYEQGKEMKKKTNIYRQNGWSHKGPAESPESVWLETNHHFNVLAKPLQACIERKEVGKTERRESERPSFNEVCTSKFNAFLCAWQQRKITFGHP